MLTFTRLQVSFIAVLVAVGCDQATDPTEEVFWEQSDIPGSAYIGSLVEHPNGTIFAGTQSAGLYRSTDEGVSWSPVVTGITDPFIRSLVVTRAGTIFAGTDTAGVFRSTDAGSSWRRVTALAGGAILSLTVTPQGQLFAGTMLGGTYKSTDDGNTWLPIVFDSQFPLTSAGRLAVDSLGRVWATVGPDLYRSADGGTTSTKVTVSSGPPFLFAVFAAHDGRVYVGSGLGTVFHSVDNGGSWSSTSIASVSITWFTENSLGHVFAGTSGAGVYRTTSNGDLWTPLGRGVRGKSGRLAALGISSLLASSKGYLYVGDYQRILRSIQSTVP
ncbi:MAG: YCF48-related protein [Bacteroidota bacterium]